MHVYWPNLVNQASEVSLGRERYNVHFLWEWDGKGGNDVRPMSRAYLDLREPQDYVHVHLFVIA